MNDNGQIREFDSKAKALEAGFRHELTRSEAEELRHLPESERVVEFAWKKFHATVLGSRRVDPMEKARYKLALKFAIEQFK